MDGAAPLTVYLAEIDRGAMALVGKGLGLSATEPDKIGVLPWLYLSLGASF